ncbi:MAG: hypothetical protein KGM91_16710 [Burkholderiales bacterium]|nr:hypothetical protein [Burkholderiales bacterium]
MFTRRQILQTGATAAALPAFGAFADSGAPADADFQRLVENELTSQLHDRATAAALAPIEVDVGFTWSLPTLPAAQLNSIVAYSFGNRPKD